jgi:hypothetical protein
VGEEFLHKHPPDVLFILPWNLATELSQQLAYLKNQGVQLLRAIPRLEYF